MFQWLMGRFCRPKIAIPFLLASISGHKTTSMLFRYAHADTYQLQEKIKKLSFSPLLTGQTQSFFV
jgi:hypothetical protein